MVGKNSCGGCTICCYLFPVKWLDKGPNQECEHCDAGCLVQDTKPAECRDFDCAWLQSKAPVEMRPDKCGIVFEKLSDQLFYGSVWKKITPQGRDQVHGFLDQGFSVVLVRNIGGTHRVFIAPGHDEAEIRTEFQRHVEEQYGYVRN